MTQERRWQTVVLRQALNNTGVVRKVADRFQETHSTLVSMLTTIHTKPETLTQAVIDEVYAHFLSLLGETQTSEFTKRKRAKVPKAQTGRR